MRKVTKIAGRQMGYFINEMTFACEKMTAAKIGDEDFVLKMNQAFKRYNDAVRGLREFGVTGLVLYVDCANGREY